MKLSLNLLSILFSVSLLAQNTSPNFESFELPTLPVCWQSVDADGDGFNWESWYEVSVNGDVLSGNTGVGMMISASYDNVELILNPDNYLILPQLDIQEGEHLTYSVAGLDPDFSLERYSVVLSTAGDTPEDFNTTLLTDTTSSNIFEEITVDLSAYEGQQVYLAFRHHDISDQFVLRIDDVQYPSTVDECPITVSVEEEEQFEVNIYPNPTSDLITVNLGAEKSGTIQISNLLGELVYEEHITSNTLMIDADQFPKGMYILNLNLRKGTFSEKVVVE